MEDDDRHTEGDDEQLLQVLMRIEEQNGPTDGLPNGVREDSVGKLARMHEALRRIKRASSQTVAEFDSPTCLTDAENAVPMQR